MLSHWRWRQWRRCWILSAWSSAMSDQRSNRCTNATRRVMHWATIGSCLAILRKQPANNHADRPFLFTTTRRNVSIAENSLKASFACLVWRLHSDKFLVKRNWHDQTAINKGPMPTGKTRRSIGIMNNQLSSEGEQRCPVKKLSIHFRIKHNPQTCHTASRPHSACHFHFGSRGWNKP